MSLLEHLATHTGTAPVWIAQSRAVTARRLRSLVATVRDHQGGLLGADVAVACRSPLHLALAMVALDGFAARMLLMSSSSSAECTRAWLREVGCGDFRVVSDDSTLAEDAIPLPTGDFFASGDVETRADRANPHNTEWIIPTSGTSGTPKLVAHSLESLTRTTRRGGPAGDPLRWGLVYDLHRFAGLQVFLQAWFGSASLIFPGPPDDIERLIAELERSGCSALSATPSMWRRLLMSPGFARLPLRQITLGGEIADQPVLDALAHSHPSARVVHIYASTEAGVGFRVVDGRAGFPAEYLSAPPSGVNLRIRADGMLLVRPDPVRQRYVGSTDQLVDHEGWIETGDVVESRGDRIHFLGRANGAINVGGRKVMPEEIESVIRGVPGVAIARVAARRSSILGHLVEAAVVTAPSSDPARVREHVMQACARSLEDYKRPAVLRLVDSIALSPAGKLVRT